MAGIILEEAFPTYPQGFPPDVLERFVSETGGRTFPAADLRDARRAFAQVAEEIGKLYSLGYYPTNKTRDGRFRAIRVEVKGHPGAQVSAREGYQAPKS